MIKQICSGFIVRPAAYVTAYLVNARQRLKAPYTLTVFITRISSM